MYNRYIPKDTSYEPIPESSPSRGSQNSHREARRPPPPKGAGALEGMTGKLGGMLKSFHLEELDSGDILLVLILIFLFLESDDNLELVITLGLLLLFGLFGDKDKESKDQSPPTV